MKSLGVFLVLMMSALSWAGQHRGGGDGVMNDGNWSLLDLVENHQAVYYFPQTQPFFLSQVADRMSFVANHCAYPMSYLMGKQTGMVNSIYKLFDQRGREGGVIDERTVFPDKRNYLHSQPLNRSLPGTKQQFSKISSITTNLTAGEIVWMMTDKELEEIPDEGTIRLPDGQTRKQLAIQKNGVVLIYRPIFEKLDDRNKGALILHELLLFAQMHGGATALIKEGTPMLRQLVHSVFSEDFLELPESALAPFCGWHGKAFSDLSYQFIRNEYASLSSGHYRLDINR